MSDYPGFEVEATEEWDGDCDWDSPGGPMSPEVRAEYEQWLDTLNGQACGSQFAEGPLPEDVQF